HFDWCIIDEASQATEAAAWLPLQLCDRLVLAGDPFQLPPTIISQEAEARGFGMSLMERLMLGYGKRISVMLNVQYRMNQKIMEFPSREFYADSLTAFEENAQHVLSGLANVQAADLTNLPVQFIDTAGANYEESEEPEGASRLNIKEALLAQKYVQKLLESGVLASGIAVIAPYSAQVRYLRELVNNPEIEIDSVDGFQGREKEAVIFSMVRSNPDSNIGFLEDTRRMNVAMTRAKRKLIMIGDSATITSNPFYNRMVTYFESIASYFSVWDEIE
ncbi:MAG: AAA domain-containing protein, partial [Chloroflexota bacterium]